MTEPEEQEESPEFLEEQRAALDKQKKFLTTVIDQIPTTREAVLAKAKPGASTARAKDTVSWGRGGDTVSWGRG